MDEGRAEEEFANVAFEILDKNALVKILERLDPKSVLKLCRTNKKFSQICKDENVFFRLMKSHYPGFPINEEVKLQYMAIAEGKIVKYVLPYIKVRNTEDSPQGIPVECEKIASINPSGKRDMKAVNFSIMGTPLSGVSLWVAFRLAGIYAEDAKVFPTKEEAIDSFYPKERGGYSTYVKERENEFEFGINTARSPSLTSWLKSKNYPVPLTAENSRKWFEEKGYLLTVCKTVRSTFGKCAIVVLPFEIK